MTIKILIIGAAGATGKLLTKKCLEMGYQVTALDRMPNKFEHFSNINVIQGDVLDYDIVKNSVAGQNIIISCLGASRSESINYPCSQGTKNIIKAMLSANVSRIVAVSSIGVGSSHNYMNLPSKFVYQLMIGRARLNDSQRQEELIMNSGLKWTIIRPPRLTSSGKTEKVKAEKQIYTTLSDSLERHSLAEFIVDVVAQNNSIGETLTVIGQ